MSGLNQNLNSEPKHRRRKENPFLVCCKHCLWFHVAWRSFSETSLVTALSESLAQVPEQLLQSSGASVSLYVKRRELNKMILKVPPLSLSYAGNLDSVIQTCTCCEESVRWKRPWNSMLRFILLEMKELESKKAESSTGSDVLPQRVWWSSLPVCTGWVYCMEIFGEILDGPARKMRPVPSDH